MFCPKCGAQVSENERFCRFCGEPIQNTEGLVPASVDQYTPAEPVQPQPEPANGNVLKKGILGLVFAETFFISFLGIIFSAMALGEFKRLPQPVGSKARVGRGLAIGGLISGIIGTVAFVIWLIVIISAASNVSSYRFYY